ncbi:MAG: Glycerol-3-phosphate dehydrogenase [NAD(P)+] [Phycisphaerae bacterium]|nr:Glycerol-3-phosphate dehydrogenase [NAD(P)+] [Phycisphaerae bacterium]
MIQQVAIIGDGAMGTLCSLLLAEKGITSRLWGYDPANTQAINQTRRNERFLPGVMLSELTHAGSAADWPFEGAQLVVNAIPCQFIRTTWTRLARHLPPSLPIVSITKGIEVETQKRPTQILEELCGPRALAVMSGPSIAHEVANRLPATVVVAGDDAELCRQIQNAFTTPYFRVYTNNDVIGVELAGAMKNVIAIAAGIIDGLQLGDNAKAALISRGLVEITRLGIALGARGETFAGLTGVGDLITTCISPHGRNRTAGQKIGEGWPVQKIIDSTPSVIEGIPTTRSVLSLATRYQVDMPITGAIYQILYEQVSPTQALNDLMTRQLKAE